MISWPFQAKWLRFQRDGSDPQRVFPTAPSMEDTCTQKEHNYILYKQHQRASNTNQNEDIRIWSNMYCTSIWVRAYIIDMCCISLHGAVLRCVLSVLYLTVFVLSNQVQSCRIVSSIFYQYIFRHCNIMQCKTVQHRTQCNVCMHAYAKALS